MGFLILPPRYLHAWASKAWKTSSLVPYAHVRLIFDGLRFAKNKAIPTWQTHIEYITGHNYFYCLKRKFSFSSLLFCFFFPPSDSHPFFNLPDIQHTLNSPWNFSISESMNTGFNKKLNLKLANPIINWKIGLVLKFNSVMYMYSVLETSVDSIWWIIF